MTLNLSSRREISFYPPHYSKWERSTKPRLLWATPHKSVIKRQQDNGATVYTQPQTKTPGKFHPNFIHNDSTTLPNLSRPTNKRVQDQVPTEKNINALMFLIISRRKSIKDLEKHCEQLQELNLQMARSIMDTERISLCRDKEILSRQEQTGRSVAALRRWGDSQIKSVKAELTDAKKTSQMCLSGLQEHLDMVKAEVLEAQKQRHLLKTYKDMEFPVKALQIADLERQLERLRNMQKNEQENVKLLFEKEIVSLEKCHQIREQEVLSATAEKHVRHIPPIVKLVASQNHRMREGIHMHRKEIIQLEEKNKELIKSIQELQLSRPNIRREIFPDVFLKSDKCTPDMDVHLTVPQEDLLPI